MRAAKVQASLRIRAVSPEPPLLSHTSSESRGTFRQKTRSLAPLNGWACAVKICHDGMLKDTNSLDGDHFLENSWQFQLDKSVQYSRKNICIHGSNIRKRITNPNAGPGGSVGCISAWFSDGCGIDPMAGKTYFCGDWSWNPFYGYSLPTPDSSRAVASYWWKDVL